MDTMLQHAQMNNCSNRTWACPGTGVHAHLSMNMCSWTHSLEFRSVWTAGHEHLTAFANKQLFRPDKGVSMNRSSWTYTLDFCGVWTPCPEHLYNLSKWTPVQAQQERVHEQKISMNTYSWSMNICPWTPSPDSNCLNNCLWTYVPRHLHLTCIVWTADHEHLQGFPNEHMFKSDMSMYMNRCSWTQVFMNKFPWILWCLNTLFRTFLQPFQMNSCSDPTRVCPWTDVSGHVPLTSVGFEHMVMNALTAFPNEHNYVQVRHDRYHEQKFIVTCPWTHIFMVHELLFRNTFVWIVLFELLSMNTCS
jgi:hypothetical protein